ncbi:MAG TPA: hypothetical protein VNG31_00500 [Candidatus Baltobacteraceae bacterium]|nr:hypothetical protein [Candidatus Baltobacteraceae bacterium]
MLLRTLFALMLFAALAETMLHGAHALAQAAMRRQAIAAVRAAVGSATTSALTAVAAAVASGQDPRNVQPIAPTPAATCALNSQTGCLLLGTASIVFATTTPASPAPCPQDACTIYAQGNDTIDEGRITATISATAVTISGAIVASRSQVVPFRTFRQPPYAAPAGELDPTVAALTAGPGDDGGAVPNGTAPGTLIDVVYRNQRTGASMPGNVWVPVVQASANTPAAWSP